MVLVHSVSFFGHDCHTRQLVGTMHNVVSIVCVCIDNQACVVVFFYGLRVVYVSLFIVPVAVKGAGNESALVGML